jgi:hypothetical protein
MQNNKGHQGIDPKPEQGKDNKGHKDNGKGKVITTKPGTSHTLTR